MLALSAANAAQVPIFQTVCPASDAGSSLVVAADGNLYGTTRYGGSNDMGTVFRLAPTGTNQVIYSFSGGSDGANPMASLVVGPGGFLYGAAQYGGASNAGTIFIITTNGVFILLHSFNGNSDGAEPVAGMVLGNDANLYGTASRGGALGNGTVFQMASGNFAVLHNFDGTNGCEPAAALVQGTDGAFYGTTSRGGPADSGVVFSITATGVFSNIYNFTGAEGAYPQGALVQGADHLFYGTTPCGGGGFGSVYRITPGGAYTTLYSATNEDVISTPLGGVAFGADGKLYGTAAFGGAEGFGSVFDLTTNGNPTALYSFGGSDDGANPAGGLALAGGSVFYGVSSGSGMAGAGTDFRLITVAPVINSIQLTQNGQLVTFNGTFGIPDTFYTIFTTTNPGVAGSWIPKGTNFCNADGAFGFTNLVNRATDPTRFYRVGF